MPKGKMNPTGNSFRQYPVAMVNITNRCTLRCKHCFVFREDNPNGRNGEMDTPTMLARLAELQKLHNIQHMLWMGGETPSAAGCIAGRGEPVSKQHCDNQRNP